MYYMWKTNESFGQGVDEISVEHLISAYLWFKPYSL